MEFAETRQPIHVRVFFGFLLNRIQIDVNYGLCDVNARRLMVPAGSRRQKSSTFMSVPRTLYQVSGTNVFI